MLCEIPPEATGAGIAVVAVAAFKTIQGGVQYASGKATRSENSRAMARHFTPMCMEHGERIATVEAKVDDITARVKTVEVKVDDVRENVAKVLKIVNGKR